MAKQDPATRDAVHEGYEGYFNPWLEMESGRLGAFRLGDNPPGCPMLDLKNKINPSGLEPPRFLTPDPGETVLLDPTTEALR